MSTVMDKIKGVYSRRLRTQITVIGPFDFARLHLAGDLENLDPFFDVIGRIGVVDHLGALLGFDPILVEGKIRDEKERAKCKFSFITGGKEGRALHFNPLRLGRF